jgi:hypothetical protein
MPFLIRSVLLRRSGPLGVALTAYDVWRRLAPRRRQQLVAHGRRGGIAGVVLSVFGLLARMVVFGLVGIFLIKAAVDYSAKQAVGLDGALPKLAAQSDGPPCPASSLPGSCRLPCSRSATRAAERSDRRRLRSARGGHEVTDELRLLDANEARFVRDRHGLRPRVDVELREDPLHVARHRLG